MARFSAEGLTYPEACRLINYLKSKSIDANISAGGVAVYPDPCMVQTAKEICSQFGASFKAGYTSHKEDFLLQGDTWDAVERETNDSISVLKEFE